MAIVAVSRYNRTTRHNISHLIVTDNLPSQPLDWCKTPASLLDQSQCWYSVQFHLFNSSQRKSQ